MVRAVVEVDSVVDDDDSVVRGAVMLCLRPVWLTPEVVVYE